MKRALRETAFKLARRDLAEFLTDHEDELLQIFREEMRRLDDQLPDEQVFIDIKMVPLGEAIVKTALIAIRRFLLSDFPDEKSSSDLP